MSVEWWKNSLGYQIYIRSFKDGNNDGNGDLLGIIEKLDYIKSLGVDFIWINPCFESPMDDCGYDVKNYFKIDKIYGNTNILKKLIKKAHSLNIKVVLDFVINHTSIKNEWFIKSENKQEPYADFYIWKNGKLVNGKMQEPNNWQSFFGGSAWHYSEKRKQYYLSIFTKTMPDINYENDIPFIEMEKVLKFYAEMGVDGFRIDAVAHIGKNLTFEDCKNENKSFTEYSNLSNTHKYLKKFNTFFSKYNLVTMGELGGEPTKKDLLKYSKKKELDMVFSFEQLGVFSKENKIECNKLINCLKEKQQLSNKGGWSVLFWLNHDYGRLISKINGEKDPKNSQLCLAALMYFLKGTPIIYNGEEIGMQNYEFKKITDFKDVWAKNILSQSKNKQEDFKNLQENSRDHARTIMQWSGEKNAGFSESKAWTYLNKNYKKCNVEISEREENSILNNYRKIFRLRKQYINVVTYGKFKFFNNNGVLGYIINHNKDSLKITANLSGNDAVINGNKNVIYSNFTIGKTLKPYQVIIEKV